MSKSLFKSFPEVSSKAWKQKIQVDLKGADYNDTLIWNTNEGIDVKPFYHQDEFESLPEVSDSKCTQFRICQTIIVENLEDANRLAIEAVENGAEAIKFNLSNPETNINALIKGIDSSHISVHIETTFVNPEILNNAPNDIVVNTDIIGHLAKTGNWYENLSSDHKAFESIVSKTNTISIDMSLYQNAGATISQQLAYGIAHVNEYLNHLNDSLNQQEKDTLNVVFDVAIGSNYFFEIAKLRALRQLWKALASEYNINTNCHIFASPSRRNKTIYDYNTNMLRTTTECMSAILGGANTISNLAYDAIYHKPNDFGERISRNQLLILKHESYFDKVDNPSDGSYYIESLTEQLSEKALDIFKDIESNGGFLNQLKEGTIQRKIKDSALREEEQFEAEKLVLLGTNRHPNPDDKMKNELELQPFVKTNPVKTLIEPIIEKRLSEKLDINRLNKE